MENNASYKIITAPGSSEIVVTKSRFIGNLVSVSSVAEAEEYITSIRKKYNDARHNCWAYIIMDGDNIIKRSSDDGEPSGTAGRPMMAVLEGADVVNAVCTVTRYFGGVLLGTGGLVRAYTDAAQGALGAATLTAIRRGITAQIICDYADEGSIRRLLENMDFSITDSGYTDKVKLVVLGPEESGEQLVTRIVNDTSGRASAELLESLYY